MKAIVIDDVAESLAYLSNQLAESEVDVIRTWNCSDAKELLQDQEFDAIIASAICTSMDVINLCRDCRNDASKKIITILILQNPLEEDDVEFLKKIGFDHVLESIDAQGIVEALKEALANSENGACSLDEGCDPERLESIVKKITDNALGDLGAKAKKLEEILENSTDVIYELDPYGRIILISSIIEKLTGYTHEELIGMNALEMTSPESIEVVADHISKLISGSDTPIAVEVGVQAKDGHVIPAEMIVRPIWQENNVVGILGIGRNVEERKLLEKSLKEAMNEKDFYLDLMAHDIQNYNQAIVGYLEMIIGKKGLNQEILRYSKGALRQVSQIAQLIAHIKRVAQIRNAEGKHLENKNLLEIIQNSITKLQSRTDKDPVAISFDHTSGDFPIIAGEDIHDLIDLLISSAARYSIEDLPHIKLILSSEFRNGKTFWVIDMSGMNLRVSDSVVSCVMSQDYSGCQMMERPDLQLLVVRAIVETIGGEMEAKNPNNGNSNGFIIRLPKAPGDGGEMNNG